MPSHQISPSPTGKKKKKEVPSHQGQHPRNWKRRNPDRSGAKITDPRVYPVQLPVVYYQCLHRWVCHRSNQRRRGGWGRVYIRYKGEEIKPLISNWKVLDKLLSGCRGPESSSNRNQEQSAKSAQENCHPYWRAFSTPYSTEPLKEGPEWTYHCSVRVQFTGWPDTAVDSCPLRGLWKWECLPTCQSERASGTTRQTGLIQRWKDHHQDPHRKEVATAISHLQVRQPLYCLDRSEQIILFRLRTGHNRLNDHLFHKLKMDLSEMCPWYSPSDKKYLLQHCPPRDGQRGDTLPENRPLREKLYVILRNWREQWHSWRPLEWASEAMDDEEEENKDHVTNEEVCAKIRQVIGPHKDLQTTIKEMQTAVVWAGQNHLARHSERGKKTRQTEEEGEDNITEWTGLEFGKSQRAMENRGKWSKLVAKSSVVPQRPSR